MPGLVSKGRAGHTLSTTHAHEDDTDDAAWVKNNTNNNLY